MVRENCPVVIFFDDFRNKGYERGGTHLKRQDLTSDSRWIHSYSPVRNERQGRQWAFWLRLAGWCLRQGSLLFLSESMRSVATSPYRFSTCSPTRQYCARSSSRLGGKGPNRYSLKSITMVVRVGAALRTCGCFCGAAGRSSSRRVGKKRERCQPGDQFRVHHKQTGSSGQ